MRPLPEPRPSNSSRVSFALERLRENFRDLRAIRRLGKGAVVEFTSPCGDGVNRRSLMLPQLRAVRTHRMIDTGAFDHPFECVERAFDQRQSQHARRIDGAREFDAARVDRRESHAR